MSRNVENARSKWIDVYVTLYENNLITCVVNK